MLTDFHLDALKEIVNTGVGRAAASLNIMLESHIELEVPSISIFRPEDLDEEYDNVHSAELACVQLGFRGHFNGSALLVFPPKSAVKLVAALTGEDPGAPTLNAIMAGTLNEVGNIVINGVIGTIGNYLAKPFDFSLPNYMEGKLTELLRSPDKETNVTILLVRTRFRVENRQVEGSIFLLFELGSFDALLAAIDEMNPIV